VPKYDYRCGACGLVYEKREGFNAPSVQECPECPGQARRVFSPPAIVFKGSGWYKTDSRGAEPVSTTSGTSSAPSKPDSPAKTDTAPSEAAAAD
jgi:putative FmdB family regulatory protein